ncbi:MAG: hypothetical protein WC581_00740 [Thermodesulfovibrionales bacterium]
MKTNPPAFLFRIDFIGNVCGRSKHLLFYFTLNEGKIASYCLALDKFIVEAYFKPYRGSFYKISRGGDYAKKYDT